MLRELRARPSGSRTIGQTTISVARRKSATMRRSTATCAASFWPKKARSGSAAIRSLATTVATPRKWPGRDLPSRRSLKSFDFDKGRRPLWVYFLDRWGKDDVCACSLGKCAVCFEGARIAGEVLVGTELRGVDEDADRDLPARSRRGPDQRRVPACSAPRVGTRPIVIPDRRFGARPLPQFVYSAKNFHPRPTQLSQSCNAS